MGNVATRKLSKVVPVQAEPVPDVVELLESLLADAKAGTLQWLIAAYDGAEKGTSGHAWAISQATGMLVYELETVKLKLLRRVADEQEAEDPMP